MSPQCFAFSHRVFLSLCRRAVVRSKFREAPPTVSAAQDAALEVLRYLNLRVASMRNSGISPDTLPPTPPASAEPRPSAVDGAGPAPSAAAPTAEICDTPSPGTLLVAHPMLGFYWRRSVVLMLDHTEDGSLGVVLNSPNFVSKFSEFGGFDDGRYVTQLAFGHMPVWEGGPVSGTGAFLHRYPELGGKQLGDSGIVAGGSLVKAAGLVQAGATSPEDFVMFSGGAAWDKGQLEQELKVVSLLSLLCGGWL